MKTENGTINVEAERTNLIIIIFLDWIYWNCNGRDSTVSN